MFALLIALVCIETAQQVLVVGVFDVDDIILDFIGSGFGILAQIAAACFIKKTNERIAVFISRRRISAPPAFAGIAIIAALIVVGRFTRMVKMK